MITEHDVVPFPLHRRGVDSNFDDQSSIIDDYCEFLVCQTSNTTSLAERAVRLRVGLALRRFPLEGAIEALAGTGDAKTLRRLALVVRESRARVLCSGQGRDTEHLEAVSEALTHIEQLSG